MEVQLSPEYFRHAFDNCRKRKYILFIIIYLFIHYIVEIIAGRAAKIPVPEGTRTRGDIGYTVQFTR